MNKLVKRNDIKFIAITFTIALISFLGCLQFKGPGIIVGLLLAIMTLSIGCGCLRLMCFIRDC